MIRFEPMGNDIWIITENHNVQEIGYIYSDTQRISLFNKVYSYYLLKQLYCGAKLIIDGKRKKGFTLNV
jgi:hypothetical protein